MESTTLPVVETLQFGGFLLAEGLIRPEQLQAALDLQKERPFLHLGEVLCLMGVLDEKRLATILSSYHRESRLGSILLNRDQLNLEQLAEALTLQSTDNRPLGEILVSLGYLDQGDLELALMEQADQPVVSRDLFDKCRQFRFFREAQAQGTYPYFQPLEAGEASTTRLHGRDTVLLAANSYLGLTTDPEVIAASVEATRRYGVGTSGSPLLNGTMDLHVALERDLAAFMGKAACNLYSTGFQTNLGVISALVGRGDVVIADSYAHASIHDGCRLGYGDFKRFNHNNMAHLEQLLKQAGNRGKLVVVDGVYSMDGDLADLPTIVRLAKEYGAKVLLDDAHGFGVMGAHGRGTAEYFGLLDEIDLIMLTFSKSLGTIGGCVLGNDDVLHFLRHRSRPFVFSASLPPGTVAATHASLRRIQTDPSLRLSLSNNVAYLRRGLVELGYNLGASHTQILPVQIGDEQLALRMGSELMAEGVLVATVITPGVPPGQARLRVSVMASHTVAELQLALDAFEKVGKRLGII